MPAAVDTMDLSGRVALVTGAGVGIGRAIALELARRGARIGIHFRTSRNAAEATLAEITELGSDGVLLEGDVSVPDDCRRIVDEVTLAMGRLDILVNNAFALPDDLTQPKPFWEKPLSNWEMIDVGVRSNFVAAWHAARIMAPQKSGLVVAISGYTGVAYTYSVVFGTSKSAVDRMARDMAIELKPYNVASISLWQGLTLTELAQRNLANIPGLKDGTATRPKDACSPEFPGRVIAALASDPQVMRHSGGTHITAELAREYGITDIDGKIIPSLRAERGAPIWSPI